MPSDPVVLSVANVQPETQIPFLCLEDGADAPFLERMEKIIHSFQDIVDLYNQPASPPPTDDLLVRMTKHSQALHDFQSYCFAGIEEMKAYLEENMTKWKNLAQSQMEELCRLKVELEQQNLSQKKDAKTLKTVEDQLQAKQKALKDVEKEKKQQEKKVEELQKKLIAAQEETRKRESVVQAHELKIQQLNSQVGAHKKELNDAKKNQPNPQAAGAEKKKFESKIAELDRGLAAAQSKAKSEEEKATAARNERNSAMEKQKAHFRELQKARKDLEDVRKKAQLDLQAQAASFTGQDERWKEKLFRLEQDHVLVKQSLEAKIVDLAGSMQTQSQELDRQRGVVQRQKEQIQRQQEQIQRQQEQIQCQQEQIHRQQEQIQAQQEDIQSLRQKLKQADSERQVLTQMVRDLQQQVKDIEKGIVHYQPFGDEDIADRIRLRNLLDHAQAWLARKAGLAQATEDQSTEMLSALWRLSFDQEKSTWARIQSARKLLAGKDLGAVAQSFVDNNDAMQIVCELRSRFRGRGNDTHRTLERDQYKRSIDRFFELNPYDDAQPFLLTMLDYTFA